MRSRRASHGALAAALLLAIPPQGCIPAFPSGAARAARTTVPQSYGVGDADPVNSARLDPQSFFVDARLSSLIETALQNNQELNIAIQESLVLESEVLARRGEYLPSLGFSLGAGLDRVGRFTSQGQADEHTGVAADLPSFAFRLNASWEVDIWGRLRNAASAAQHRFLASREGQNFVITRLVAEIASKYYELIALDRRLEITRSSIELQQRALDMVRVQQQASRVSMLAVQRFEAQLRGFQSHQYEIAQRIVEVENELNFLLGRFPQPIERNATSMLELDPPVVHTGVTTQLLENRPDVRRAELELRAAQLDVSAARARFYPSLRLEGAVGYQSFDIVRLLNTPDSLLYSLLAGITAPLLNRNAITAEYFSSNSRQMQAVVNYERAILNAFLDVNTAMNLVRNLSQSYALKREQVQQLSQAVEVSMLLFSSTRADYLEVLTTRRDYLEAQMDLIETRERQLTATVLLYRALGGGWRRREASSAPPARSTAAPATPSSPSAAPVAAPQNNLQNTPQNAPPGASR